MKRALFNLLLVLAVFLSAAFVTSAQTADGGDTGGTDVTEDSSTGKADTPANSSGDAVAPSDTEGTTLDIGNDSGLEEKRKAEARAREARRLAEKKAEEKRAAELRKRELARKEEEKKDEAAAEDTEAVGDSLLMIDHDAIIPLRIPGITLPAEETGLDIVKIPGEEVDEDEKASSKGGIFGPHTDTIAKWGLLLFVFVIFLVYRTRAKRTRRKVVRTITKR
jgi:hypothetical protein